MIRVEVNVATPKAYLRRLETRDLPRVIGRSLDRTRNSGKSFLSRVLRQRVTLPKSVVDKSISTRRGGEISRLAELNAGGAWFEIRMSGDPVPLRDFRARATRKGVTFQVSRSGGRKTYAAKGQPGFIVSRFGGHVFVRKGPDPAGPQKVGIRKVFGPALPHFLRTRRVVDALVDHCREFFFKEVIRNARFAIQRRGG